MKMERKKPTKSTPKEIVENGAEHNALITMLAFQLALFDHLLIQAQFSFFITTANYIYNTDKLNTITLKKKKSVYVSNSLSYILQDLSKGCQKQLFFFLNSYFT